MKHLFIILLILSGCSFESDSARRERVEKNYSNEFNERLYYTKDNKGNCFAILNNPVYSAGDVITFTLVPKEMCN